MKKDKKTSKETASQPLGAKDQNPVDDPLEGIDPLSAALLDPLSQALAEKSASSAATTTTYAKKAEKENVAPQDQTFEPWSFKRTTILSTYTTSERIPITTSFLSEDEKVKLETKAQAAVTDKVKHRLEQLDDMEEGSVKETLNLDQKEYLKKIDDMNSALTKAWECEQRVKALKIAIQCAKLLVSASVIKFYPSKFVLITDILDNFGRLVFDRIRSKSSYQPSGSLHTIPLPENFTSDQVPDSGKETCRNWFFKIASIRELIPRFYVEAAILRCYSFLSDGEYTQALVRLTHIVRGIGDPLVSAYARSYLCRVGLDVAPETRLHLLPTFTDFLKTQSQLNYDFVQNTLAVQRLDVPEYLFLYAPAIEWILQCLSHQAKDVTLDDVLSQVKDSTSSAIVLNAVLCSFRPEYISSLALQFADMIKDAEETGLPKYKLYVSLGNCVLQADPSEKDRLPLLNKVWKNVMKLKKPNEYIACTQVWIEYVAKHFSKRELNTLLDDIIKHMAPERAFESHYAELVSIVNRILTHITDFSILFSMDKFLPFIDMLQKESVKIEVCKSITNSFALYQKEDTHDPVIFNAMMYLCKMLHDSLNALSLEDERRQVGALICGFLRRINFGRDFEQQLNFFVEARSSFTNLGSVLVYLIHSVNLLAMRTRAVVKGNHTRKTAAFVRACAAYCFITIPSLTNILARLNLYVASGRVAVANGALSQADAFFKAAINALKDVPPYMEIDRRQQCTEPYITAYINNFLSVLLVVPDNPDMEVFYLLRGLLNAVQEYQWTASSDHKIRVYMNTISLLSAACQDKYLYGVEKVDSNDSLYAGGKKFVTEVAAIVHTLLEQILEHLKSLTTSDELRRRQALLALGLFTRLISHADISEETNICTLLVNLWILSQKYGVLEQKLMKRFHLAVTSRQGDDYQQLAQKLTLPGTRTI